MGRYVEHHLVTGNVPANRLIVGIDFNSHVSAHGMTHFLPLLGWPDRAEIFVPSDGIGA